MKRPITFFSTLLFFFLLQPQEVISFTSLGDHLCHHADALALLQLKEMFSITSIASYYCSSRGQHSYPKITHWQANTDCCNWDGVTCHNITGRIIGLDLSCSKLQGFIYPNTSLFHLSHLRRLNLAYNNFTNSQISHQFGWMKSLTHLNLSGSYFHGEVASEISHLSNLISLDLSDNFGCQLMGCWGLRYEPSNFEAMLQNLTHLRELKLSGVDILSELRVNFSSSLTYLDLSGTGIRGDVPGNVFHLPNLQVLSLASNMNLSGSLPEFNCSISGSLRQLDLQLTNFSASLPNSIGCIGRSLNSLNLGYCQISGVIPESIGNLTQVSELDLSDNLLVGEFPSSLLNLMHLEKLYLSSNLLTGEIGDFKSRFLSAILLDHNQLNGSIPPSIFTLPNLYVLDLSSNHFTGVEQGSFANPVQNNVSISYPYLEVLVLSSCQVKEFPEFLRNLESLRTLDLSNNMIQGEIPSWFTSKAFGNLLYLNLSHNLLTGTIDQLPITHRMAYLDMSSNSLQGPIPTSICDLNVLTILDLSNNNLSSPIPKCLGNCSTSLRVMDLGNNRLFGTIPTTFSKCNNLQYLMLNDNQLQGPVPRSLAHCKYVELLDLGTNKIDDRFPIWMETLAYLEVLILKSNRFHGVIGNCQTESPFPLLRIIDASHNKLTGALPKEILSNFGAMKSQEQLEYRYMVSFILAPITQEIDWNVYYYVHSMDLLIKGEEYSLEKVLTVRRAIDFSNNRLEGQIPEIIGSLHSLQLLTLSHNNFSGHIPKTLGNLSMLESLDLSCNQLEGTIPREILNLDFLEFLNLSENRLSGPIPPGRHLDTFGNESYRGNSALCGFPLTKDCGDTETPPPPATPLQVEHYDSEFFDGFTWKAVLLGYGCGLVLGLVMGMLMFSMRKPRWFVQIVEDSYNLRRPSRKWIHIQT